MPSEADLALARALHASGRASEGVLRGLLLASTAARPLAALLLERGLVRPDELAPPPSTPRAGGDATLVPPAPGADPASATAPRAASFAAPPGPGGEDDARTLAPPGSGDDAATFVPPSTHAAPRTNPAAGGAAGATLHPGALPSHVSAAAWRPGAPVDRYRIIDVLGQGGMGIVLRVEDTTTGGRFAMKTLNPGAPPSLVQRFLREGEAQARVDAHPNVVRVRSSGEHMGRLYLVMDLCGGGDLEDKLRKGPLPPAEAARIVAALARGLAHVHRMGITHRDLKPSNVLFDDDGVPKLVDFGVARLEGAERLTLSGSFVGTPAYASPEQCAGERAGAPSDIYGLGAILYHALTGERPFTGESPVATIKAVLTGRLRPPRSLRPEIPPALEEVVLAAMSREVVSRPRDGDALAAAIEAALAAPSARRGALVPALALLALLGLVAAALAWRAASTPATPAAAAPVPPATPAVPATSATPARPPTPTPASPLRHWDVAPGEALAYRIGWTERNNASTTIELGLDLTLVVGPDPGERVTFEVRIVASSYVFNGLRRVDDFLGVANAAPFIVVLERRTGAVAVTGLSALAALAHEQLPDEEKEGGARQGGRGAVCLGQVVQRALSDDAFGRLIAATFGAGPSAGLDASPWVARSAERARATDARVTAPLLLPAITDLSIEGASEPFVITGEASYEGGRLRSARVRQLVPWQRLDKPPPAPAPLDAMFVDLVVTRTDSP